MKSPNFRPRPAQKDILSYKHGTMGISAVPGSGKTWTLSYLAASLISAGLLKNEQEILIVTLVNSAVENFSNRISSFLSDFGLLPNLGYRVRTLHGLAHDIVRERPDLLGLDSNFQIIDEREANRIRTAAAEDWLLANPDALTPYLNPSLSDYKKEQILSKAVPELVQEIALQFIRTAKDMHLSPQEIRRKAADVPVPLPLVEAASDIYAQYQQRLNYRGAVDFDDLIRLAYQALSLDADLLQRLRSKWPYILEDEAQDSSRMQERILQMLAENWVRVGDPNQAIYETFTTADPRFLKRFIATADYSHSLPASGRSTLSIISLANHLVSWTRSSHPVPEVRDALSDNIIEPTPAGDHQPNPADRPDRIHLAEKGYSPAGELKLVARSLQKWLPDHPDKTVAVLVPRNQRAFDLASVLRKKGIEPVESLLRSTSRTRKTAGALGNILAYLSNPESSRQLSRVYLVWRREDEKDEQAWQEANQLAKVLSGCTRLEEYLSPQPGKAWIESLDLPESQIFSLLDFRNQANRWLRMILLPIDQLVLTLSQDLFKTPLELAIAHKLAVFLGQLALDHPDWGLPELTDELAVVARNERRFMSFTSDTGFLPEAHRGKVVLSTIHKAKGLEWDRVYLLSVNNYNFPSGEEYDSYIAEKWFIRDELNIPAEALSQLKALFSSSGYDWYTEGKATQDARLEYIRERLRLLYVGITRAREELVITWNTGKRKQAHPAMSLIPLWNFWKEREQ